MHFKYGDVIKRTRTYIGGALVIAGITTMVLVSVTGVRQNKVHAAAGDFTFAVAGDFAGETGGALTTMTKLGQSSADFLFSTGDLDQGAADASTWCSALNSEMNKPAFLLSGNHEAEDAASGYGIADYVPGGCEQPTIGSLTNYQSGSYGKDYYVDYPATSPKVRIIAISPELTYSGTTYDYSSASPRYTWVSNAIDTAKTNGEWVVVAFHKPYLNAGGRHGDGGADSDPNASDEQDVFNLALDKRVDLLIHGHEHNYMRSKQLVTDSSACPVITRGNYDSACVGNSGPDYVRGEGAVEIINIGAGSLSDGVGYDSGSGDADFFAKHVDGSVNGYVLYTVTDTSLTGKLVSNSGSTLDTFTITGSVTPPADTTNPTVSLTAPADGATVSGSTTLTATALDDVGVTKVEFFYDNGIYIGESTTSPYTISWDTSSAGGDGPHLLIAKAYDAAGNMATSSITVTVNNTTPPTGDITPPTVSNFTATTPSSSLSIPITAFAASDTVGVTGYLITRSSTAPTSSASGWSATAPSTYTVTGNGTYTLYPWAKDAAGNVSAVYGSPRTVAVNVPSGADTTPPTVSITSPAAGNVSGTVLVVANAQDAVGVTRVEFYSGTTLLGTSTTSPYAYSWDTTQVTNGSYSLTAKAYDGATNNTVSSPVSVTVNNTTQTSTTSFTVKNIDDATKKSSIDISGTCMQSVAGTESTAPASIKSAITGFAFTSNCTAAGGTASVVINLEAKYDDLSKIHVYKEMSDKSIKDITADSKVENKNVAGATVTVVSYSVKDGDAGDLDGKTDGKIVDPVYVTNAVASSSTTLAKTGATSLITTGMGLAMTGLGIGLLTYKRTRTES